MKETNGKPIDCSKERLMALRQETGAGLMDCKHALITCGGDFEAAKNYLYLQPCRGWK